MWPGDLAPDDSNLGPSNQLLRSIDKGNLLAEIEAVLEQVESVDGTGNGMREVKRTLPPWSYRLPLRRVSRYSYQTCDGEQVGDRVMMEGITL